MNQTDHQLPSGANEGVQVQAVLPLDEGDKCPSLARNGDAAGLVLVDSDARFSDCRRYRYTLIRRWADGPAVAFIGLNPSTADESADDPTIRRCLGFARRWGYGRLIMLNLYGWRATDPRELWRVDRPDSEPGGFDHNLAATRRAVGDAELVVCAWGANPGPDPARPGLTLFAIRERARVVALALTKHGQPRHPLYVRSDVEPIPYPPHGGTR